MIALEYGIKTVPSNPRIHTGNPRIHTGNPRIIVKPVYRHSIQRRNKSSD